ncbi:hypothetical protein LWI29_010281 [Acer saccharum]|uniref:Uncharacterized protein n=1 Tax=Acer saccharum TaxID=4024 RepID=A0AA39SSI2_ACESA|nr:hypothetical protein LWI29_010281 [Acer saccharum]
MDATILVPLLIEKLLDLVLDEAPSSINPVFDKKVQTALNNLHSLKRYLQDAEDHEASYGHSSMNDQTIALLLKAVYSADDATDNLIMRRELLKMRLKTFNNPNPSISSLRFLSSQFLFIQKVKKFKNEFRRLSSCDHHLVKIVKEKIKEPSYDEWSRVIVHANNAKGDILPLIYQDLPSEIKPCFLYMGIFPKGFEIPVRRLIHLWSAKGFLTPPDPELIDPEDLAEMCFEQLIIRNMVQVRWKLDGHPKTCSMPSFLYDFFTLKAEAAGFFNHQLHKSSHTSTKQSKVSVRRLAAYFGVKNLCSSLFYNVQGLCSYVAFDTRMRGTAARDRKLLQLSYLGLRSTFIDNLPYAVSVLPRLATLDVRHTNIREICFWEAKKLRHLYLNQNCSCYLFSEKDSFANLHTVWGLHVDDENLDLLEKFTRLTKLKLIAHVQDPVIAECVSKLTNLQSLKLISIAGLMQGSRQVSNLELWTLAEHHKLRDLYLLGILQNYVIDVHFLPPNLRNLTLSLSQLKCDPMPVLGKLPHLNRLRLFGDSYTGKQITCLSGGFPKLRLLNLWKLPLQDWTVEEGAMPCLNELEIRDCYSMKPPEGLKNVTTLKELVLTNMPMALEQRLKKYCRIEMYLSKPIHGVLLLYRNNGSIRKQ